MKKKDQSSKLLSTEQPPMDASDVDDTSEDNPVTRKFKECLLPKKVIRDPVHGDIWLTDLEILLIDNLCFQRLRKIRQLGPTQLVYPGANHSRFEHSIGTLHMAKQIIDAVNKNCNEFKFSDNTSLSDASIIPEKEFIIRIVALLHDAAHIAFGHTIEQEGLLFEKKKQWLDSARKDLIYPRFAKIIREYLSRKGFENPIIKNYLKQKKIDENLIDTIIKDIESILIAEESGEKKICELKDPYIADIVGNTICADLLDYLRRDAYFSGLSLSYDSRLLSYFVLKRYCQDPDKKDKNQRKLRLAILLEKEKGIRTDIMSECVDLLRLRYSLAERVYYHRAKTIASAMVIKMIYCAKLGKILNFDEKSKDYLNELLFWGDDTLIYNIFQWDNKNNDKNISAAKKIAKGLASKKLYKIVFPKENYICTIDHETKVDSYTSPFERHAFEEKIEEYTELPPGSIILYVTKKDPGKEAQVKVFLKSVDMVESLKYLIETYQQDFEFSSIKKELEAINSRYSLLWKVLVLIDEKELNSHIIPEDLLGDLESFCKDFINQKGIYYGIKIRAKMLHKKEKLEIKMDVVDNIAKQLEKSHADPREISIDEIDSQLRMQHQK